MVCDSAVAINLQCIQFNHHTQETVIMNYTMCFVFIYVCRVQFFRGVTNLKLRVKQENKCPSCQVVVVQIL